MIERPHGEDSDLIIVDQWPAAYNEDSLRAAAAQHTAVAAVIDNEVQQYHQAALVAAQTHNAGLLAEKSATAVSQHIRDSEQSSMRHKRCATEISSFAQTVIDTKTRIIEAVKKFSESWAEAPTLAKRNNWYQHQYSSYRTELIDTGRRDVKSAVNYLAAAHNTVRETLHTALDE